MIIGALIAATVFSFAVLVWDDTRVAAVVSLSLLASTVVATFLPYQLARLGPDPAFGSGPLATVIQDLLTMAAYFAIASSCCVDLQHLGSESRRQIRRSPSSD